MTGRSSLTLDFPQSRHSRPAEPTQSAVVRARLAARLRAAIRLYPCDSSSSVTQHEALSPRLGGLVAKTVPLTLDCGVHRACSTPAAVVAFANHLRKPDPSRWRARPWCPVERAVLSRLRRANRAWMGVLHRLRRSPPSAAVAGADPAAAGADPGRGAAAR